MEKYKLPKLFDAGNDLNQRWFVYYSYIHPETGKYKRFRVFISSTLNTATARREKAKELVRVYSLKLKQGWNPFEAEQISLTTCKRAIEIILELKKDSLRIRSYYTLKNVVKSFNEYLDAKKLNNLSVEEFNSRHAIEYLDWVKKKYSLTNRTVNYRRMNIKTLFNELIYREYVQFNPFIKTQKLQTEQTSVIAYSKKDLELIKNNLRESNFNLYIIALLIFYCFIRPQELVRLKIQDIDLPKRRILLPGKSSKNKKSEVVVIPDQLYEELLRFNLKFPKEYFIFGKGLTPGPIYTAPTRIAGAWAAWTKEVGLTNNGIYALKHTGAGMALESGINVRDLQLQLRHHSLEMTQKYLDRFSSVASDRLKSAFPSF